MELLPVILFFPLPPFPEWEHSFLVSFEISHHLPSHSPHHKDAAVTGNQTGLIMKYPEQTITRLTQRLGRAPTPEEIKAERDTDRLIRLDAVG